MPAMNQQGAQLHDVLTRMLNLLDNASALVEPAGIRPPEDTVSMLHRAKHEVLQARSNLLAAQPAADAPELAALALKALYRPEPAAAGDPQFSPEQTRFVLHTRADVNRLLLQLMLPRKMPRMEVRFATLPPLETQRLQDRIVRIRNAAEQQIIGPAAAGLVILFGAFRIVAFHSPATSAQDLKDFGYLFVLGFLVWAIGKGAEIAWSRARLLRVLLRLRRMQH